MDVSWCRHCGEPTTMTAEHVPPRSVGNDRPIRRFESLSGTQLIGEIAEWKDGHTVRTLCTTCNTKRPNSWGYVNEYKQWHEEFVETAKKTAKQRRSAAPLNDPTTTFEIAVPYDFQPAKFVRQVIGMFLAVQTDHHLASEAPALQDLVGPEKRCADREKPFPPVTIAPWRLMLSVGNVNYSYNTAPMLAIPVGLPGKTGSGLHLPALASMDRTPVKTYVMALPPFVFVLASDGRPGTGFDISSWTERPLDGKGRFRKHERHLRLPTVGMLDPTLRHLLMGPGAVDSAQVAANTGRPD